MMLPRFIFHIDVLCVHTIKVPAHRDKIRMMLTINQALNEHNFWHGILKRKTTTTTKDKNGKQHAPLSVKVTTIVIAKSNNIQELDIFKYQRLTLSDKSLYN